MRLGCLHIALIVVCAGAAFCGDQPAGPSSETPLVPCAQGGSNTSACEPSKKQIKEAKSAFERALKLQRNKQTSEAFAEFETAAKLVPKNVEYVTAREVARQQLVYDHLERGNDALLRNQPVAAMGEFRAAIDLDPHNEFAAQRLKDAAAEWAPKLPANLQVLEDAGIVSVAPRPEKHDFHFRGDSRTLLQTIAQAYGVGAMVEESVPSRHVRFDMDNVDFFTAMSAASSVTKTFWTPLDDRQILIAVDNPENHRQFDRMALRTFYIPSATAPQDVTDMVNLLRNMFEIRFVTPQAQSGTIAVRAPVRALDAATQLLESLDHSRPQVMLDIKVYQISSTYMRNMGLQIPNSFQLFNIPAGALAALGGQNIQDLINQLIAQGGINQANSTALSALLAQLQGQQNSIFKTPVTTFGNGLTLMGLSLGTAGAQLSLNSSSVQTLEHAILRAGQGNEVSFRLGSRYPILNASFAPIFNSPAISQVIQNNTFQAAFPSFSYEDLGLTLKAKPSIYGDSVGLQVEMQFRTLLGNSLNGVPIIANREFKGTINLMNGQPAVVAGSVSTTDMSSMNGIPGFGAIPGVANAITSNSKEQDFDELLLVISPHVVSPTQRASNGEVWLTK